jgi:hypothetical protein
VISKVTFYICAGLSLLCLVGFIYFGFAALHMFMLKRMWARPEVRAYMAERLK